MFWQQFAVLAATTRRGIAATVKHWPEPRRRLGIKRPCGRGVFIASIWFAFVLAITVGHSGQPAALFLIADGSTGSTGTPAKNLAAAPQVGFNI